MATARVLVSAQGVEALRAAAAEPDPGSLAAATRLRSQFPPDLAAAALNQTVLRAKAATKLPGVADSLLLTADGLEQATRWQVATWRAARFAAAGITRVADLCCGLGIDALALVRAGIDVVAVERDPAVAVLARANLGESVDVIEGDAEEVGPRLIVQGRAVFCDPARRTRRGRSWDVADLSPGWEFVEGLLTGERPAVVKLGPGFGDARIPSGVEALWVASDGDLVECGLWHGFATAGGTVTASHCEASAGRRAAVLLPAGDELIAGPGLPDPISRIPAPGDVLFEPAGAVLRAGAAGTLAARLGARPIADRVAYLIAERSLGRRSAGNGAVEGHDSSHATPFAAAFEVVEVMPWKEKLVRAYVADRRIGTLEIKKRGLDVDPAALRTRLRPRGPGRATLVLTPTAAGAMCLVVRRLASQRSAAAARP